MTDAYLAEHAWLSGGPARQVRIEVRDGRIASADSNAQRSPADRYLPGLTLPGFANTHSHAFHRALRGRTHHGGDTFWTWRERMYALAGRLDPDSYYRLATATYAEMALAGVCAVGEFHYLHHAPGGHQYSDPNAMGVALIEAAKAAGIRITLLDTCYVAGGLGPQGSLPLGRLQARFGDGDADGWARRMSQLQPAPHAQVGAAIHSIRAVPRDQLSIVVAAASGRPLHVHLSEQAAENEQCAQVYGLTPTALLAEVGVLGADTTAVHATHLTTADIQTLGGSRTSISMCPTTERDLADGIGPAHELRDAGAPITLGSDQHAVIDLLEEARAMEMDERLSTGVRGRFTPTDLLTALTRNGQRSLGWHDAGSITVGARADLTTLRLDSVRTAGSEPDQVVFTAGAPDIHSVVVDGRLVVDGGRHVLGDVGRQLVAAIDPLWA
ncbi:MAG: formimidoylglutamate deiminase [Actinomycetota bacterium]|nr:formimidoylglutamate deiminase [Actinomycetota bacterium]